MLAPLPRLSAVVALVLLALVLALLNVVEYVRVSTIGWRAASSGVVR